MAKKFAPDQLKLKPIIRGILAKVHLENGVLNVKNGYKIVGQPFCKQLEDNTKEYDFMLSFNDLMGSYEWKLYNLFGYNFSESALISVEFSSFHLAS